MAQRPPLRLERGTCRGLWPVSAGCALSRSPMAEVSPAMRLGIWALIILRSLRHWTLVVSRLCQFQRLAGDVFDCLFPRPGDGEGQAGVVLDVDEEGRAVGGEADAGQLGLVHDVAAEFVDVAGGG